MEEYFKQNFVKLIKCLRLLEEHFLRHDVETNVISDNTLLTHLTQRLMRCMIITWRLHLNHHTNWNQLDRNIQ